jgi:hypothetical protein
MKIAGCPQILIYSHVEFLQTCRGYTVRRRRVSRAGKRVHLRPAPRQLRGPRLGGGAAGAATAIGILGCASLAVTVALIPGLRRTRPRRDARGEDREALAVTG